MRTVVFSERIPASDVGRTATLLTLALAASYTALVALALLPSAAGFLGATVVIAGLEALLVARAPFPLWMLGRIGAGGPARGLGRGVAALVLLVRTDVPSWWLVTAASGLLGLHVLRAGGSALAEASRIQRKMPILVRGLDVTPLRVPPPPPSVLTRRTGETLALPDLFLTASAAVAALTGTIAPLVVGLVVAALTVLAGVLALLRGVLAMRQVSRTRFVEAVSAALDRVAPEVALYLGSGPDTLYQVEMWVETLEQLDRPAVIILRDRASLAQLGATRVPVICIERGNVLMSLRMATLRLALYVAHATSNLHLLRRPGVTHVFIGHGDSDKPASVSPFLKAYDEIWLSGPAARDRFNAAGLGQAVRHIAEVGRPQLDTVAGVEQASHEGGRLTALYAPTWEGYGDELQQTSLDAGGVELVRELVRSGVRVLYRPHPLTGTRDPVVARAHRQVTALLGESSAARPTGAGAVVEREWGDLDLVGPPPSVSRTEHVLASEAWARAQLHGDGAHTPHRLVPGPQFSLRVCFDASDVLLADVSSVVSDFVSSGKPYGVTNPAGLSAAEFVGRYPSSQGGYLVESDGRGLDTLLSAGRGDADPAAQERAVLRERLLGPTTPALDRVRREVDRVVNGGRQQPLPGSTWVGRQESVGQHL